MSLWRDLNFLTRNLLKIASQYIATGDSYHNSLNFCCDELNIPSWDGNICKTAAAAIVNKSHSVLFRISSGKWFGGRATLCLHKFLQKEELGRKFWSSSQFPKPWKWKWRYCQIKDRNKRQITGLITTRRIATKILEFIAITQKLWKRKWKWRYCQKSWGQETNHNTGLITTRRITRPILDFIAEAFRGITSKVKVIEIAPFIAQHLLLNKLHFSSIASLLPVIYISEYKTVL